jgi:FkbH-like protein
MVNEDDAVAMALLARPELPLAEVMAALSRLDRSAAAFRTLKVGIAANITVDLLGTALRRHGYASGVRLQVAKGHYDDLQGDVQAHRDAGVDLLLLLPFFDNLQPGWETQLDTLDAAARDAVHADYLQRLALALDTAKSIPQVLLLQAHLHQPDVAAHSPQQRALDAFNTGLAELAARHANVRLVDTAGLLARHGARQAFDARFWFRGKAPYTAGFVDQLAQRIAQATRGFGSRFHKVLVLDCDNTLWGGIVGEDGIGGIQLDAHGHPGNIFRQVQQQIRALEAQGVLVCLCSKNNDADVAEVLALHPAMALRAEHVVARKVNWDDKPANLRALAAELNLGLDSFVFVDDSSFEVQAVRERLPMVTVFQVPAALHAYPALVREQIAPLFVAAGVSAESRSKTQQYRSLAQAATAQGSFASHEDYLRSLGLKITLHRDNPVQLARIAELTAKSNQFNLTTQRLQAGDLTALMQRPGTTVYAFTVSDRFADHGLTGVLITEDTGDDVAVHSFLMSCRVIGRGVEFAVWRAVVADALQRGKRRLCAAYRPTAKNAQVADFYDRLGLPCVETADDGSRCYAADLAQLQLSDSNWVEVEDARS